MAASSSMNEAETGPEVVSLRFSLNIGGLSRNWRRIVKNEWFSAKIAHKSGYDGKFR